MSPAKPGMALLHIIPVPYEKSVCYGKGTSMGPSAVLEASQQLEVFDGKSDPSELGIHTHPPINCSGSHEIALNRIEKSVTGVLKLGKVPVMIGGEHTISFGAVKAVSAKFADFGVVQFDAHGDLRDSYQKSSYSHACVLRRIHELGIPVFQIGVRSICSEEHEYRKKKKIPFLDAEQICTKGIPRNILPSGFPKKIYLTVDIDAMDPSVIPSTGTPVPGGLGWYQMMELLEKILKGRKLVGMDLVEFSPVKTFHYPDFTAANLLYNIFGIAQRNKSFKC